jgi:hypothetical protein
MKKYKVTFEERFNGIWNEDYFSNNGEGFTYDDALHIKQDLASHDLDGIPVRNVQIEEI